jgi:microcystin-dependent protein
MAARIYSHGDIHMNTYLFTAPKFQPLDATGALMPASYVQFYLSDSTTPVDVYADGDLNTPLANPVVSDSDGVFPFIYMDPEVTYRAQFYNAANELVWDCDPYTPPRDYAPGTVITFMGTAEQLEAAYPAALWQVCDGTNGTYDLRGKFMVGVSSTIDPGEAVGSVPGTLTTSEDGGHTPVVQATTLTASQIPAHSHFCAINNVDEDGANVTTTIAMARASNAGGDTEYALHGTASTPTVSPTSSIGSSGSHTHGADAVPDHTHTIDSLLPPAVGVWWVMRKYS